MRLFELDHTIHLMNAIQLLTQLSKEADMNSSPAMVSFVASHISSRFAASLRLAPQFFAEFSFTQYYDCRIFIDALYDIMFNMYIDTFESMILVFSDDVDHDRSLLMFESPRFSYPAVSGLVLLPSKGTEVGEIDYRYFFSMDMDEFKHIVTELHIYHDTITVIVTDSQVKFSVGVIEIVLTKEENQCLIGRIGLEAEVETKFLIVLHPKDFFLSLALESESKRIWFFKSIDSCTIIAVPFGLYAQVWVYFPQM